MSPSLHLVCGLPGAGKTMLARELETSLPAVRLCPDEWIDPLLTTPGDRAEMDRLRPAVEALQWQLGQRLLTLELNVILENGFWAREERLDYLETARRIGSRVVLHYLDVPRKELKRRIERRNADLRAGSFLVQPEEIDTWLGWFEPPEEPELARYDSFEVHGV